MRATTAHAAARLARLTTLTLGPKGRTVVMTKPYGSPLVSKDGATVAHTVEFRDPFQNMVAQMMKEAAARVARETGDGTTTTILLTQAILTESFRLIEMGFDSTDIRRGLLKLTPEVSEAIDLWRRPVGVDLLYKVALSATGGDQELALEVLNCFHTVGTEGLIEVAESFTGRCWLDLLDGVSYDKGWLRQGFCNDALASRFEAERVLILIIEDELKSVPALIPICQQVKETGHPLLVISGEPSSEVLEFFAVNNRAGIFKVCLVPTPSWGDTGKEMLMDLGALTGAFAITSEIHANLRKLILDDLGCAEKVIVTAERIQMIGTAYNQEKVTERTMAVRRKLAGHLPERDRTKANLRLRLLSCGAVRLHVGAPTEAALKERKARAEDGLRACRTALKDGVVPGAGSMYLSAAMSLVRNHPKTAALRVLTFALQQPFYRLCKNAGLKADYLLEAFTEVLRDHPEDALVFDVSQEKTVAAYETGLIDPALVVRVAFETAVSLASELLVCDVMITDKPEKKKPKPKLLPHLDRRGKGKSYERKRIYNI